MTDARLEEGWIERRDDLRLRAANGNPEAVSFLANIMDAVETWDDLVDKDKQIDDSKIHCVFMNLIFWLPQNQFFIANRNYLLPIVMTCINAWMDSNEMQKHGGEKHLRTAWHLKQMGVELYGSVAFLTGGFNHMRMISLEARDILAHEDFSDYIQENKHA